MAVADAVLVLHHLEHWGDGVLVVQEAAETILSSGPITSWLTPNTTFFISCRGGQQYQAALGL